MKKSIFKRIGLVCCAIALAISSIFIGVQKNGHNKSLVASANDNTSSSIVFNGSNIWLPISRTNRENSYLVDQLLININFSIDRLNNTFNYNFNGTTGFYNSGDWSYQGLTYNYYIFQGLTPDFSTTINLGLVFDIDYSRYQSASYYNNIGFLEYALKGSQFPIDSEIVSVSLGYVETVDTNFDYPSNFIKYTDANSNFITFYFRTITGSSTANRLVDRTYYFSSVLELSYEESYTIGYQNGLADNQQNIYDNGYDSGYNTGYYSGRSDGIASANDYSFTGLITSVIDVPVQTFMSLLNFEILGFDLLGFVLGLLTFALVIFVIKMILGLWGK